MFTPTHLQSLRAASPFVPFRIVLDDGRTFEVPHRELFRRAFVLVPLDGRHTRLIVRDRAIWPEWQVLPRLLIFEPGHAYMETGVLRGVKQRVESMREVAMA